MMALSQRLFDATPDAPLDRERSALNARRVPVCSTA